MPDASTRLDKAPRPAPVPPSAAAGVGAAGAGVGPAVVPPPGRERTSRPVTPPASTATTTYPRPDQADRGRAERPERREPDWDRRDPRDSRDVRDQPMAAPAAPPPAPRALAGNRRARLRVSHISPLSVLRVSFVFSLCVFVVLLVAAAVLWGVLDSIGVFNSVVKAANTLTDKSSGGAAAWVSFSRVMELTLLVGAINVILMTALSTLGALLYNLCGDMIGGVELTLSEQ